MVHPPKSCDLLSQQQHQKRTKKRTQWYTLDNVGILMQETRHFKSKVHLN